MAVSSPPIDIRGPSRTNSASPQHKSNLTSALQQAGADGMDISYNDNRDTGRFGGGPRHDSLGVPNGMSIPQTGPRPIASGANRRGSNTGSFMSGMPMSFGGMSFSSFMQDDIMMAGTSPLNTFNHAGQSPQVSSSYLPKLEADYWKNLRCCDKMFDSLHELLQHYEDVHRDNNSTYTSNRMSTPGKNGFYRRKSSTHPTMSATNHNAFRTTQPQQQGAFSATSGQNANGFGNPQMQDAFGMDSIGEMEMDFGDAAPFSNQANTGMDASRMRPGPINAHLANAQQQFSTPNSSHPATPATAKATPTSTNPVVSQVNTPSFTTSTTTPQTNSTINSPIPTSAAALNNDPSMLTGLNNDFRNMDFSSAVLNNGMNSDMFELTINDPARALFSENGGINAQQAQLFGFVNGASTNPDSQGGAMQLNPMATQTDGTAGINPPIDPYGGEDRPFRCLVIGCEKAYKNANGLRYHERHGHQSQQLVKNTDGTLSIVDPNTGEAFPGTMGMEKEKPYRCDKCGKRYKNLNGLKYHKNHSPPCNPELDVSKVSLPGMGGAQGVDGVGGGMDTLGGWEGMGVTGVR